MYWYTCFPPYISFDLLFAASCAVAEHMTDSEILRGTVSPPAWHVQKASIAADYIQSPLFVLVLLLVIRWQGLQFPEGEIRAPPLAPLVIA